MADKQKIPTVAIHLEETNLPPGLELTLSDLQAIIKYEMPVAEYENKLYSRIAAFIEQPIAQPTTMTIKPK
jgi:hypothetical protein